MSRKHHSFYIFSTLLFCFLSIFVSISQAQNSRNTISFAFTEWKPILYLDESNTMRGIYGELLYELFEKRLNLQIELQILPWKRCQLHVEKGSADFTIMLPTDDRLIYSVPTTYPVYQFYLNVFTYRGHPQLAEIKKIKSAGDIKRLGLIPATNLGNGWHKTNIDNYGIETVYLAKDAQLFQYLQRKRSDIVIDLLATSLFYIKEQGLQEAIEITDAQFGPLNMHLMMSKKSPFISKMPIINETLEQMWADGFMEQIIDKYESPE